MSDKYPKQGANHPAADTEGHSPRKPRRFIAGAVCPRCGVMDRIVVSANGEIRSCIECGFSDERPADTPAQVPTRVTRAAARRTETSAEVVRLLDTGTVSDPDKDS